MFRTISYACVYVLTVLLLSHCRSSHEFRVGSSSTSQDGGEAMKDLLATPAGTIPCTFSLREAAASHAAAASLPSVASLSPLTDTPSTTTDVLSKGYNTPSVYKLSPTVAKAAQKILGPFTSSSGVRVVFKQEKDAWYAEMAQGSLPVQSCDKVAPYLRWLAHQDAAIVRSRLHILDSASSPSGSSCVYLGRLGLLGGTPTTQALQEKWLLGPSLFLTSNETRTEVYHIQPGYRYKDFRVKSGAVIDHASCVVHYVEANSREEIDKLRDLRDSKLLAAELDAHFTNVVRLGTLEGEKQSTRTKDQQEAYTSNCSHAALVIYGDTKQNALQRGKIRVRIEVRIEKETVSPFSTAFQESPLGLTPIPTDTTTSLLIPEPATRLSTAGDALNSTIQNFSGGHAPTFESNTSAHMPSSNIQGQEMRQEELEASYALTEVQSLLSQREANLDGPSGGGDEQKLLEVVGYQSNQMWGALNRGDYAQASMHWHFMNRLSVIDHISIDHTLHRGHLKLQRLISQHIESFKEANENYRFDVALSQIRELRSIASQFNEGGLSLLIEIDISALTRCLKEAQHKKREEDRLCRIRTLGSSITHIEAKKRFIEDQLASQKSEFSKEQARLQAEMTHRDTAYGNRIAKIWQEYTALLHRTKKSSLQMALSDATWAAQQEEQKSRLCEEYEKRLETAEKERKLARLEYEWSLQKQQEAQMHRESELQACLAALTYTEPTTIGAHHQEERNVLLHPIPDMAFGAEAWKQYYGDVGKEPPLSNEIDRILDGPCPFWLGKRVRDTHWLTLIPYRVNEEPFSLDLLGKLIQQPHIGGHATQYACYRHDIQSQFGSQGPFLPYWVLVTKDVLPNSRGESYINQKKRVDSYAHLGYTMPTVLEVATSILAHYVGTQERLYSDDSSTYTRCQELADENHPIVVGSFSADGLDIDFHRFIYDYGVSCCRKL